MVETTAVSQETIDGVPGAAHDATQFIYHQSITYGFLSEENSIRGNEEALFVRPFQFDSQRYVDALFEEVQNQAPVDADIFVVVIPTERLPTALPSTAPSKLPSVAPVTPLPLEPGTDARTAVIIVVTLAVLLIAALVGGAFYLRRINSTKEVIMGEDGQHYDDDLPMSHIRAPSMSAYGRDDDDHHDDDDESADIDPYQHSKSTTGSYVVSLGDVSEVPSESAADRSSSGGDTAAERLNFAEAATGTKSRSFMMFGDTSEKPLEGVTEEEHDENGIIVLPPPPPLRVLSSGGFLASCDSDILSAELSMDSFNITVTDLE